MNNKVDFKIKGLSDQIGPPEKTYTRMSLADYNSMSEVYNEYENNNPIPQGNSVEQPTMVSPSPSSITNEELEEQGLEEDTTDEALANRRKELRDKYENHPDVPPHLRLSPEELIDERRKAVERYLPAGTLSAGTTGLQKEMLDTAEVLIKLSLNSNKLVDEHFYIQERSKNKIMMDKDKLYEKLSEKDEKLREENKQELYKKMNEMELKVPDEVALSDLSILTKFSEKNPKLEVDKMNKEEKEFYTGVLKPMTREINKMKENNEISDVSDFLDKESQDKIEELYGKHKKASYEKTIKKENKKDKTSEMSPSI